MKYPTYPYYRDSTIEWLGKIPKNWYDEALKHIASCNDDTLPESTSFDYEFQYVEISDVSFDGGILSKNVLRFNEAPTRARRRVKSGDIIISTVRTYLRAIASIDTNNENLVVSTGFAVLRPYKIMARFMKYAISAPYFIEKVVSESTGVNYPSISSERLMSLKLAIPSHEEQVAITRFLEIAVGNIDSIISKQLRMIELLKDKRQAIITHAITKGIDHSKTTKDSGIEWIGEIPQHWRTAQIKWLSSVKRGASPRPIDDPKYFDKDGEYAWVRISDVTASNGVLETTSQRLSILGSSYSVKLDPGELFVSIAGSVGKPCISRIKACIHDGFVYFPKIKLSKEFLFYIFESGDCYSGLGKLGTQLNLNTDTIGSIHIPIPPSEEVERIVSYLKLETSRVDSLIVKQQQMIELLKEHKSSLINQAVTGKIDVRGLVQGVNNSAGQAP